MPDSLVIRPAQTPQDYRALQAAQRAAWGITEEEYVVPVATMAGAALHGGLVLGAFQPDGRAVGLSFAFLGKVEGQPCLYSQLTGVVPNHQSSGVGTRLKLAQRDFAVREGLPAIAWAFDPLQAGNARFNLVKLGAIAIRYYVNMYGPRTDAINQSAPTDRMLAWWPVSPSPRPAVSLESLAALPRLIQQEKNLPVCAPQSKAFDQSGVRIDIPPHINRLRIDSPALATAWVVAVRAAFGLAFERRWIATSFVGKSHGQGFQEAFYVLRPVEPA